MKPWTLCSPQRSASQRQNMDTCGNSDVIIMSHGYSNPVDVGSVCIAFLHIQEQK